MKSALIGHRGVGKTSLLKRIEAYFRSADKAVTVYDLDREIEYHAGRSVSEIFNHDGELEFRRIEQEAFVRLEKQALDRVAENACDVFVAMGAGFDSSRISDAWRAIWIRRSSDADGRVFFDRPRLNSRITELDEFAERFRSREQGYRSRADETLWLSEGQEALETAERRFFLDEIRGLEGAITLFNENFRTPEGFARWAKTRVTWGVRWFELRDDLLSSEHMQRATQVLPPDRVLVSFRDPQRSALTRALVTANEFAFDWPLELGDCSFAKPRFLSLHRRAPGESIAQSLANLTAQSTTQFSAETQLKAALPVEDFKDLETGRDWQNQEPGRRIFLPGSEDGRWSWFRRENTSELSFFRESDGSSPDQPTLLEWDRRLRANEPHFFAAVLGDPVRHSRTPIEQQDFFAKLGVPVYAIRLNEGQWRSGALQVLKNLGLRWAAVTAPLKTLAYEACGSQRESASEFGAVNTMVWKEQDRKWQGTNTDYLGMIAVLREASIDSDLGEIAVWGGSGTLAIIRKALSATVSRDGQSIEFFAARSGENRDSHGRKAIEFSPDTLLWAAGFHPSYEAIPETWRPRLVIDLNYSENSPARVVALRKGALYLSGLSMFKAQAAGQREFWASMGLKVGGSSEQRK